MNSANHTPVVFDEPTRFRRAFSGLDYHDSLHSSHTEVSQNDPYGYLLRLNSATESSMKIQEAWESYKSEVDYGIFPIDLPKVAACIASNYPSNYIMWPSGTTHLTLMFNNRPCIKDC